MKMKIKNENTKLKIQNTKLKMKKPPRSLKFSFLRENPKNAPYFRNSTAFGAQLFLECGADVEQADDEKKDTCGSVRT